MLIRLVLIFGLIWVVLALAKRLRRPKPVQSTQAIAMVRCEQCRLAIPQPEAIYRAGKPHCSQACADKTPAA